MKTLLDISQVYAADAERFAGRIRSLQSMADRTDDPTVKQALLQRIATLEPIVRQSRALARYTAHYYDKEGSEYAQYRL